MYRQGPTTESLDVVYRISGTAMNGVDYAELLGTVTIQAQEYSASISVAALYDELAEFDETVTLTLTGTNDAPVLTVDTSGGVAEDAADPTLSDNGVLSFTDVDVTDTQTVTYAYNNYAS